MPASRRRNLGCGTLVWGEGRRNRARLFPSRRVCALITKPNSYFLPTPAVLRAGKTRLRLTTTSGKTAPRNPRPRFHLRSVSFRRPFTPPAQPRRDGRAFVKQNNFFKKKKRGSRKAGDDLLEPGQASLPRGSRRSGGSRRIHLVSSFLNPLHRRPAAARFRCCAR